MLLEQKDGTFDGGPLDVLCILHDETTGKYHPAFFEEHQFPGPSKSVEDTTVVRLKSKMHHTQGFGTYEEALTYLREDLANKIHVPDGNIWEEPVPWNGVIGIVWVVPNWTSLKV